MKKTENDDELVMVSDCIKRHRWIWRQSTMMFGFLTLIISVVGWSIVASKGATTRAAEATTRAAEVSADLDIHAARQNGTLENIDDHLQRIDKSLEKVVEAVQKNH